MMVGVNCINLNGINNELMIKVLLRSNSKTISFISPFCFLLSGNFFLIAPFPDHRLLEPFCAP